MNSSSNSKTYRLGIRARGMHSFDENLEEEDLMTQSCTVWYVEYLAASALIRYLTWTPVLSKRETVFVYLGPSP